MRFLVDAQASARATSRDPGHTAEHVADCGLLAAADERSAVIITKDDDFVVHQVLEGGPAVVWIRIGNTRKAELLRRIEADCASIVTALERGEMLVELA